MTDIPAEVMREAERLGHELKNAWLGPGDYEQRLRGWHSVLARALLARDKRAAEIVEAEGMAYAGLREGVILARAATAILTYDATSQEGNE